MDDSNSYMVRQQETHPLWKCKSPTCQSRCCRMLAFWKYYKVKWGKLKIFTLVTNGNEMADKSYVGIHEDAGQRGLFYN